MNIHIRQAASGDGPAVEAMLLEAARWVDALGVRMWDERELASDRIASEIRVGQFFIADFDGDPAGVIRFQLEDRLFWPDVPQHDSAFVHRLVVRRRYQGQGVSTALLEWAVDRARALGKRYLRLDCDEARPKLRSLYERFGFELHSFRHVAPYDVARYEYPLSPETGRGDAETPET